MRCCDASDDVVQDFYFLWINGSPYSDVWMSWGLKDWKCKHVYYFDAGSYASNWNFVSKAVSWDLERLKEAVRVRTFWLTCTMKTNRSEQKPKNACSTFYRSLSLIDNCLFLSKEKWRWSSSMPKGLCKSQERIKRQTAFVSSRIYMKIMWIFIIINKSP